MEFKIFFQFCSPSRVEWKVDVHLDENFLFKCNKYIANVCLSL
jgi:hypothetical protein